MTFETCPTCGQRHPQGMTEHRTLEGEWCSPAERERASAKVLPSTDDTVNAYMRNAGELAGLRQRAEKAEARIAELERERDAIKAGRATTQEHNAARRAPCIQPTCGFDGAHFHEVKDEYRDALDAWRGLTEEQRTRLYVSGIDLESEEAAMRLLKAAGR